METREVPKFVLSMSICASLLSASAKQAEHCKDMYSKNIRGTDSFCTLPVSLPLLQCERTLHHMLVAVNQAWTPGASFWRTALRNPDISPLLPTWSWEFSSVHRGGTVELFPLSCSERGDTRRNNLDETVVSPYICFHLV